jgi:hypothetical protein
MSGPIGFGWYNRPDWDDCKFGFQLSFGFSGFILTIYFPFLKTFSVWIYKHEWYK